MIMICLLSGGKPYTNRVDKGVLIEQKILLYITNTGPPV